MIVLVPFNVVSEMAARAESFDVPSQVQWCRLVRATISFSRGFENRKMLECRTCGTYLSYRRRENICSAAEILGSRNVSRLNSKTNVTVSSNFLGWFPPGRAVDTYCWCCASPNGLKQY
jgi:hypothetical protein